MKRKFKIGDKVKYEYISHKGTGIIERIEEEREYRECFFRIPLENKKDRENLQDKRTFPFRADELEFIDNFDSLLKKAKEIRRLGNMLLVRRMGDKLV